MSAAAEPLENLRQIVARLRSREGCPWDREQSHVTLRIGLIEEAHEVVAAIDRGDDLNLQEELGDLLLQVIMHAQIASESGRFDLDDVARTIAAKLVRRHPHVFGRSDAADTAAVLKQWDEIKREEKGAAGGTSLLDDITLAQPALMRADQVQKRVARVGFDWPDAAGALAKIREETMEVEEALSDGETGRIEEEVGDLLFAVVNLARKAKLEAELALLAATDKFTRRFQELERRAAESGQKLEALGLAELDRIWEDVKSSHSPPIQAL